MTGRPDGCSFHWCPACGMRVSQTHECRMQAELTAALGQDRDGGGAS